jgi:nicotinate (nicotinamide) nucleotide adenylyltransferase
VPDAYRLVYGLSANPIHQQHIDLVVDAAHALMKRDFNVVNAIIVPVYRRNPTGATRKDDLPETFEHRFALCQLAAREMAQRLEVHNIKVEASRIEETLAQSRDAPNYTVETLAALQASAGERQLIFLLGGDLISGAEPELMRWREPERLARLALLAICRRAGYAPNEAFLEELRRQGAQVIVLDEVETKDIAASVIRRRLATGESPLRLAQEGLLPFPIAQYIQDHKLYAKRGSE